MTLRNYLLAAAVPALLTLTPASAFAQCGKASWYALTSKTASGERMNPSAMTAAHKKLPFGSKIRVTNQNNGRSVVVRINDRGPFIKGRVLDLSKGAAGKLGFISNGHTKICFERIA
ncbi:septal ring lytic transglycosylase RlpA family protein [Limoniibacter endophyticus]|uniref:Endolytic peptidoglycan transglycosylase RlpA n=1 Tax=Limoniibacter endophyticus TaxID=1565040 RepID=A0A8J3DQG8_9HYPH|nr:septal ring lytic transglycosylase RlpA family protein [Limoniibacter endophyticus]GHC80268.1 lipoprotein A [Limoniibacter endophyticus]